MVSFRISFGHKIVFFGHSKIEVKKMDKKKRQQSQKDDKKEKYITNENPEINTDLARTMVVDDMTAPDPKDL